MDDNDRIAGLEAQLQDLETQLGEVRRQLAQAELDQWRGRIDDLEVQAHLGSLEARDQIDPLIENLRNAWLEARSKLSSQTTTASDVVGTLRDGLEQAMGEIREAVAAARSRAKG